MHALLRASLVCPMILLGSAISVSVPAAAQGRVLCFYEDANFGGFKYCGRRVFNLPPGINDTFSSVRVPRGMAVTMCEDKNFGGACITLRHTVRNFQYLPGDTSTGNWNDVVSSFFVSD